MRAGAIAPDEKATGTVSVMSHHEIVYPAAEATPAHLRRWRETGHGYDGVRFVTTAESTLRCIELGSGATTLLFLHGIGNSARLWVPFAAEMAEEYRCLVVDLPGFGYSRASRAGLRVDSVALALDTLLHEFGARGSTVAVGHSMGALVAAHMAATVPGALRGVVCVSGPAVAAISSFRNPLAGLVRSPREVVSLLMLLLLGVLPFSERIMTWAIRRRALRRMILGRFVSDMDLFDADLAAYMFGDLGNGRVLGAARNGFGYPYEDIYARTAIEPHVVVGDLDPITSLDDAAEYLELAGGGTAHILEGCGHLPMVERTAELRRIITSATR